MRRLANRALRATRASGLRSRSLARRAKRLCPWRSQGIAKDAAAVESPVFRACVCADREIPLRLRPPLHLNSPVSLTGRASARLCAENLQPKNETKLTKKANPRAGSEIFVPLNMLKKSPRNVRKTEHSAAEIEGRAAASPPTAG